MNSKPKTKNGQNRKLTSGKGNKNFETDTKKDYKRTLKLLKEESKDEIDVC